MAALGYRAAMNGETVYVSGRLNGLIAWLARMLPQRVVRLVIRRSGRAYRKV